METLQLSKSIFSTLEEILQSLKTTNSIIEYSPMPYNTEKYSCNTCSGGCTGGCSGRCTGGCGGGCTGGGTGRR